MMKAFLQRILSALLPYRPNTAHEIVLASEIGRATKWWH